MTTAAPPLDEYIRAQCRRVDEALDRVLPTPPACPAVISEAMRYSLFAGRQALPPGAGPRRRRGDCGAPGAPAAARSGERSRRCGAAGAAGRVRRRDDPHLLAHSRRPAGDGRRHAEARPPDLARRLRGRHRHPRRGWPAERGVRAARARARGRHPAPAAAADADARRAGDGVGRLGHGGWTGRRPRRRRGGGARGPQPGLPAPRAPADARHEDGRA